MQINNSNKIKKERKKKRNNLIMQLLSQNRDSLSRTQSSVEWRWKKSCNKENISSEQTVYFYAYLASNQLLDKSIIFLSSQRKGGKQIQIRGNENLIMARIIKNLTTDQIKPNQTSCNEENPQSKGQTATINKSKERKRISILSRTRGSIEPNQL